MIEAFIFDIGNVLLRFDFSLAAKKLEKNCEAVFEEVAHTIEPVKAAYESGQISRGEFQERMKAIIQYTGTDSDLVSAWEEIFTENGPMIEFVKRVHGRYPLYLLSNTSDLHMDHIFRTYPVFGLFTDAVYSYKAKCAKPDRRIYEIAIKQFGIEPGKTVFIDDLEVNIAAAREAGILGVVYDADKHGEFLAELKRLGFSV